MVCSESAFKVVGYACEFDSCPVIGTRVARQSLRGNFKGIAALDAGAVGG